LRLPDERRATVRIECFCPRSPLLAKAGKDDEGLFVWVRQTKGDRIMVEAVCRGGDVMLTCRECGRHTVITIPRQKGQLRLIRVEAELRKSS